MNLRSAQGRVDEVCEDGDGADDAQAVEVLDDVVGYAVGREHRGEEAGCAADTVVVDVLDGKEAEDPCGLEGAGNVVDEAVVPGRLDG